MSCTNGCQANDVSLMTTSPSPLPLPAAAACSRPCNGHALCSMHNTRLYSIRKGMLYVHGGGGMVTPGTPIYAAAAIRALSGLFNTRRYIGCGEWPCYGLPSNFLPPA